MECQPYITIQEFKDSPYFCSFPECCIPTGGTIDQVLAPIILESQILINSYLGYEVCLLPRKDYFIGDDSKAYFTQFVPIDTINGYSLTYRSNIYNAPPYSGTIDQTNLNLYVADKTTGNIKYTRRFKRRTEYSLSYNAGYPNTAIPNEIKTAMYMLTLNLAQRLDNMQLQNPDFTVDKITLDKSADITYGSSRIIKNLVVRSIKDLSDMPVPIMKILDRFKINKLS